MHYLHNLYLYIRQSNQLSRYGKEIMSNNSVFIVWFLSYIYIGIQEVLVHVINVYINCESKHFYTTILYYLHNIQHPNENSHHNKISFFKVVKRNTKKNSEVRGLKRLSVQFGSIDRCKLYTVQLPYNGGLTRPRSGVVVHSSLGSIPVQRLILIIL